MSGVRNNYGDGEGEERRGRKRKGGRERERERERVEKGGGWEMERCVHMHECLPYIVLNYTVHVLH